MIIFLVLITSLLVTAKNPTAGQIATTGALNLAMNSRTPLQQLRQTGILKGRGDFCWKPNYGRGIGHIPNSCPQGKKRKGLLCHDACKEGYFGVGFVCWEKCPVGFKNDGFTCRRPKPLKIIAKKHYSRGVGSHMVCPPGTEMKAGLCYKLCKKGYVGIGPVCWAECQAPYSHNCGASCSVTKAGCGRAIFKIVASSAELVANIALMVVTFGGIAAGVASSNAARIAAQKAGIVAAGKMGVVAAENAAKAGAKSLYKVSARMSAEQLRLLSRQTLKGMRGVVDVNTATMKTDVPMLLVESAALGTPVNWADMDPTGVARVIQNLKRPYCEI